MNDSCIHVGRRTGASFLVRMAGSLSLLFVLCIGVAPKVSMAQSDSASTVYTIVDTPPEINRGDDASPNVLTYPDSARAAGVEGTVFVQMVVERDGHPTGVTVVRGVEESLDEEARRFVRGMTFTPGREDGEVVRTQMTLPIRFELQKEPKMADHATADTATTDSADHAADAAESKVKEKLSEQPPELIGGLASLQREVQYPEKAKRMGVQGRVIVKFVVQKDGTPTDVRVARSVHRLLDAEAVRATRTLRFVPAKRGGKPVPVDMTMPVTFRTR